LKGKKKKDSKSTGKKRRVIQTYHFIAHQETHTGSKLSGIDSDRQNQKNGVGGGRERGSTKRKDSEMKLGAGQQEKPQVKTILKS